MNEQEIIQAKKADIYFSASVLCDVLMDGTSLVCLLLVPLLLLVADLVFVVGGNVPGVFLGLFIAEAVGWTLFGLFALLREQCMKRLMEYGW